MTHNSRLAESSTSLSVQTQHKSRIDNRLSSMLIQLQQHGKLGNYGFVSAARRRHQLGTQAPARPESR